ncbi:hypothetical protein [Acinetobacter sp. GXMZU3951]
MNNTQKILNIIFLFAVGLNVAQAQTSSTHPDDVNSGLGSENDPISTKSYRTDPATLSSAALSIASISALAQFEQANNEKYENMQMPPEIKNLEETKMNTAGSVFKRYNYSLTSRSADYSSKTNYWWNASNYSCIATVSYNGRINAVSKVSSSDCQ